MSIIVKNQLLGIIQKNPQAQGIYQFEGTVALVTSETGTLPKDDIIIRMMKKCDLSASTLRSHCVWGVLFRKGVIKCDHKKCTCQDKTVITLNGFNDLDASEKNEIRNEANKARRAWEARN